MPEPTMIHTGRVALAFRALRQPDAALPFMEGHTRRPPHWSRAAIQRARIMRALDQHAVGVIDWMVPAVAVLGVLLVVAMRWWWGG